jgi:hypothetical protein
VLLFGRVWYYVPAPFQLNPLVVCCLSPSGGSYKCRAAVLTQPWVSLGSVSHFCVAPTAASTFSVFVCVWVWPGCFTLLLVLLHALSNVMNSARDSDSAALRTVLGAGFCAAVGSFADWAWIL